MYYRPSATCCSIKTRGTTIWEASDSEGEQGEFVGNVGLVCHSACNIGSDAILVQLISLDADQSYPFR
jgi:hypothetical protein